MRLIDKLFNNFLLKIFSLILAVATWFYVFDLVDTDSISGKKESLEQVLERYNFTAKEVPVRPVFTGTSPQGYRIVYENVKVVPQNMVVFGPLEAVNAASEVRTDAIDTSEYTRSTKLILGVRSDVKFLRLKDKVVDVYLPIEHVQSDKE